jgi:hypothetical protein
MESGKTDGPNHRASPPSAQTGSKLALLAALLVGLALGIGVVLLWQKGSREGAPSRASQGLAPGPGYDSSRLTSWQVFIKPEYVVPHMPHEKEPGKRKVLVDFRGLSPMPEGVLTAWAFHVPSGGDVGMTCIIDAQGRHFMTSPRVVPGSPYDTVQFVSDKPGFHVGFSYPAPEADAEEQVFEYPILPMVPVERLTVVVQQPPLARDFNVEQEGVPSLEYRTERQGEFTYHEYSLENVEPGRRMVFRVRYRLPEQARAATFDLTAKELPAFAYNSAESLQAYRIARRIPEVLESIPCYCGCEGAAKHKNLRDCFIDASKGQYESHASGCDLCAKIAIDVDRLIKDHSLKETRALIEKRYGQYGKGTPTPPI